MWKFIAILAMMIIAHSTNKEEQEYLNSNQQNINGDKE